MHEGFGGRPPVGGRPAVRASCPPPLNQALHTEVVCPPESVAHPGSNQT